MQGPYSRFLDNSTGECRFEVDIQFVQKHEHDIRGSFHHHCGHQSAIQLEFALWFHRDLLVPDHVFVAEGTRRQDDPLQHNQTQANRAEIQPQLPPPGHLQAGQTYRLGGGYY